MSAKRKKVRSYIQEYKNTIVNLFNIGKSYAELIKAHMEYQKQL